MAKSSASAGGPLSQGRGLRITTQVFWDLAIYMVSLGLLMGLILPPFAMALGVPHFYVKQSAFQVACLVAGFLVGAMNYALCRWVVGGRLAEPRSAEALDRLVIK